MPPVLQHDLSGAGFLALEDERDLAAGADGARRVARLRGERGDEFLDAIDRPR
jgi:hypothetical protein